MTESPAATFRGCSAFSAQDRLLLACLLVS
jgi:hypothetical protein